MRTVIYLIIMIIAAPAMAADELMQIKPSQFNVSQTLDRLEAALKAKGITVFARIDHAAGAKKTGQTLPPTQLLIFGNPKLGTPLMLSNRHIAIDLPMKALAWRDANGKVWLGYTKPAILRQRHNIADRDSLFAKMAGALNGLSEHATRAN